MAVVIALDARAIDTDPGGGAGNAVMNEDVALVVAVTGHQVAGIGPESDVAAGTGNHWQPAPAIGFIAGTVDTDPGGDAIQRVAQKDITGSDAPVVVIGYQVGRMGREGDKTAIAGYRWPKRMAVTLLATATDINQRHPATGTRPQGQADNVTHLDKAIEAF